MPGGAGGLPVGEIRPKHLCYLVIGVALGLYIVSHMLIRDTASYEDRIRQIELDGRRSSQQLLSELRHELQKEATLLETLKGLQAEIANLKSENGRLRGSVKPATIANPFATTPEPSVPQVPDDTRPPPPAFPREPEPTTYNPTHPAHGAEGHKRNPFAPEQPPAASEENAFAVATPPAADVKLTVLLICYNRPDYLRRTLTSMLKVMSQDLVPDVFISQDGDYESVTQVIREFQTDGPARFAGMRVTHLKHPQNIQSGDDNFGYMKLARHFGWALGKVFDEYRAPRVIIVEDDLEVAPDFFEYFAGVASVLDEDPTVLAASAWNDIGQSQFVKDPERLYRSDFFGGLGWMLTSKTWAEIGSKWPKGYWDDWLREPPQRKGRAFIRPEVSRSYTFGEVGTSQSQFFSTYLATIKLNDVPVQWRQKDLSFLKKDAYDGPYFQKVRSAQEVELHEVDQLASNCNRDLRVTYTHLSYGQGGYAGIAQRLGFIDDVKAGVPRTAYAGIVELWYRGCKLYIAPADL